MSKALAPRSTLPTTASRAPTRHSCSASPATVSARHDYGEIAALFRCGKCGLRGTAPSTSDRLATGGDECQFQLGHHCMGQCALDSNRPLNSRFKEGLHLLSRSSNDSGRHTSLNSTGILYVLAEEGFSFRSPLASNLINRQPVPLSRRLPSLPFRASQCARSFQRCQCWCRRPAPGLQVGAR